MHFFELVEVRLDILVRVAASKPRASFITPALELDISFAAVADVCFAQPDQLLRQLIELSEVIARVSNLVRFEAFGLNQPCSGYP